MASTSSLIESLCMQWLADADVDFLTALCEEYCIVVPENKVGKKDLLLKLVLRYLTSETLEESEDKGEKVFQKLFVELGEVFGKRMPSGSMKVGGKVDSEIIPPVTDDNMGTNFSDKTESKSKLSLHKLKTEFKIRGSIGDPKQSGTLDYTSLVFQMRQGKEQGFSSKEVCAAVIQAIKPGHSLRGFLESKGDIGEEALMQILRSHLNEKDSTSFFYELANCVQKPGETAHAFCLNALLLREKIAKISQEEGCPFDDEMLRKRFFHTVYTGLRSNNIRMELQQTLKEGLASDEDLLMEISMASANEQERLGKSKNKADVNVLSSSSFPESDISSSSEKCENVREVASEKGKSENKLLAELSRLSAQVNELASVKNDIRELQKNLREVKVNEPGNEVRQGASGFRRRRIFRCNKCELEGSQYCRHCFNCGSADHQKMGCPGK